MVLLLVLVAFAAADLDIIDKLQHSFDSEAEVLLAENPAAPADLGQSTGTSSPDNTVAGQSTPTSALPNVAVPQNVQPVATPAIADAKDAPLSEKPLPLFVYYNDIIKDHLYTTNPTELGAGKANWVYQGVVGVISAVEEKDTVKLFRYLNVHDLDHVYSTTEIKADGIRSEGFEGYIATKEGPGLVPLYTIFNAEVKDQMLTTVTSHPTGYSDQQLIGYVRPPTDQSAPSPIFPVAPPASAAPAAGEPTRTATAAAPPTGSGTVSDNAADGLPAPAGVPAPEGDAPAAHPVDPKLAPVYRYWSPSLRDHYYTLDFSLLGTGRNGWRYQGVAFYIYPTKEEETVPLFRYWNLRMGNHYYTTSFEELGEGKDGYKFKGILGYVKKAADDNTVPLYRFHNAAIGDDFYTVNAMSKARGSEEWTAEGVSCYVWPVPQAETEKSTPNHYALLVPLYRYWNKRFGDHFYTTVWKEVEVGTHGWEYQGVQALVYATQQPGTVALHRYWNIRTLDHFYTTNYNALGAGGENGWKYEGIECYVDTFKRDGTVPLYRYFNADISDHFYTTKWLGKSYQGWEYEGLQCYVHPKPLDNQDSGRVKAPAGFVPLYRYYSAANRDHLLSADYDEFKQGADGYLLEGVEAFAALDASKGAVAFHRYWNAKTKDTFYTTNFKTLGAGKNGWAYKGITAYIFTKAAEGLVPLYKYFNADLKDHLFTAADLGASKNGYNRAGIVGYVRPAQTNLKLQAIDPVTGAKLGPASDPDAAVNLLAYWNAVTFDHYYTTDPAKLGNGKNGWVAQGSIAKVFTKRGDGMVKLRQYFSESRKDHRYTIRSISGGDWKYEGAVGYIYATQQSGTVALKAYNNERVADSALTTTDVVDAPGAAGTYAYTETLGFTIPTAKAQRASTTPTSA